MAGRRSAVGIGIGQFILLALGFILASVLIFGFGWWVGYDVAEQRLAREQPVVRMSASTPTPAPPAATPEPAAAQSPVLRQTATVVPATPTRAQTATPRADTPTRALPTPTTEAEAAAPKGWTVEAQKTTDAVQAAMLGRQLRQKGYDAYTVTVQQGGGMLYRVRVGRFKDRTEAKVMELRLKQDEHLPEAFITEQ